MMRIRMGKTEALSFRMPAELKSELQKLATADRRELSVYVRLALEDHVAAKKTAGGKPAGKRK
jgi:predicted transcriptional regulator